jgi:exopolysaccharide biosynthesis polyprenyl glycosylphosphotransferase
MQVTTKKHPAILFLGDAIILLVSVWLALFLRHFEVPSEDLFSEHLTAFSLLAAIWVLVFFIAGLYEKHTLLLRSRLPNILFNALVANTFFSIAFFYLVPQFGIEPKTSLFLYVVCSSVLIFIWRLAIVDKWKGGVSARALIIGSGEEMQEIINEINQNPHYALSIESLVEPKPNIVWGDEVLTHIKDRNIGVVIADFDDPQLEPVLSRLYGSLFTNVRFIDLYKLYEDLFDRIPLQHVRYSWFLENITISTRAFYDFAKRVMDISIAFVLGIVSLIFYPFVILAIKLEDKGKIFILQERVGKDNKPMMLIKFRTMSFDDSKGASSDNKITRVGRILRASRIDELPQLWNVINGTLSLIGPRPELPVLVSEYEKQIPYYGARHFIKPGLSGWAQIKDFDVPRRGVDVERTRRKLSYDLYYLKNRSLVLDLKIALKTIKTLLSKTGT